MGVHINDDSMSLEIGGATVNAAVRLDNLWRVTGWPRLLSRNEAITALTLAEWLLMSGRSADALCVAAWREELAKWATGSSGSPPLLPWPRSPPWRQSSPTGTPTNSSARTASPAWPLDSYLSRGRPHPGGAHAHARRQSTEPARTTTGEVVPRC